MTKSVHTDLAPSIRQYLIKYQKQLPHQFHPSANKLKEEIFPCFSNVVFLSVMLASLLLVREQALYSELSADKGILLELDSVSF